MAKTGRLEVAEAIAAVSGQVRVTLLGNDDFTVIPDDLFDLQFNDPLVGIDDSRMTDFKSNLKKFLNDPAMAATIDRIPERANAVIEKVADVVRLALALEAAHTGVSQ